MNYTLLMMKVGTSTEYPLVIYEFISTKVFGNLVCLSSEYPFFKSSADPIYFYPFSHRHHDHTNSYMRNSLLEHGLKLYS